MNIQQNKNIGTVLESLQNQANGDVEAVLQKIAEDYSMTWVEKREEELFPRIGGDILSEIKKTYGSYEYVFDIRNVAGDDEVVFVECVETVVDKKSKKKWTTPLVLVLEMKDGKIHTGRHYLDPKLSHEDITDKDIEKLFGNTKTKKTIKKD